MGIMAPRENLSVLQTSLILSPYQSTSVFQNLLTPTSGIIIGLSFLGWTD